MIANIATAPIEPIIIKIIGSMGVVFTLVVVVVVVVVEVVITKPDHKSMC